MSSPTPRRRLPVAALANVLLVVTMAAGASTAGAPSADSETLVATWRGGELRRDDYDSWRTFHELDDGTESIREMVYVMSMAAAAREHGAEGEPRTRLELEAVPQQVLLPLLRQRIVAQVNVSDEEIEALRLAHPEAFRRPRKLRMRSIYCRLGEGDEADRTRLRMVELLRQLADGADFAELASRESESQSRFRGGDLGFLDPDELPAEVRAVVIKLAPGELSPPVEHGGGVSIFRLEDIRPATAPGPEEVRAKLRTNLLRQRQRQRWVATQEEWLAAAGVRIRPGATDTVLVVKGYSLSAADARALLALRYPEARIQTLSSGEREEVLRTWAIAVLGARRAVELGLDSDPVVVAALRWRPESILATWELSRRVDARLTEPDDAELRRRFEAAPQRYRRPVRLDLAVIHFAGNGDDLDEKQVENAAAVAHQIDLGELSFAEAATRYSTHPSAASGGVIGTVTAHQAAAWGPIAARAFRHLEPGETTGLLHLDSGLWIFQLRARHEARPMTFDEARSQLRDDVRADRIRQLEQAIREEHLSALDLHVRELDDHRSVT